MAQEIEVPEIARPPRPAGPRKWRCLTCQFVVESELLPWRCPRCGASRVKMQEVGGKGAEEE